MVIKYFQWLQHQPGILCWCLLEQLHHTSRSDNRYKWCCSRHLLITNRHECAICNHRCVIVCTVWQYITISSVQQDIITALFSAAMCDLTAFNNVADTPPALPRCWHIFWKNRLQKSKPTSKVNPYQLCTLPYKTKGTQQNVQQLVYEHSTTALLLLWLWTLVLLQQISEHSCQSDYDYQLTHSFTNSHTNILHSVPTPFSEPTSKTFQSLYLRHSRIIKVYKELHYYKHVCTSKAYIYISSNFTRIDLIKQIIHTL